MDTAADVEFCSNLTWTESPNTIFDVLHKTEPYKLQICFILLS